MFFPILVFLVFFLGGCMGSLLIPHTLLGYNHSPMPLAKIFIPTNFYPMAHAHMRPHSYSVKGRYKNVKEPKPAWSGYRMAEWLFIYLFISQYFTRVAHTTKVGFQWGPGLKTEYIHNTT